MKALEERPGRALTKALRTATAISIPDDAIVSCLDLNSPSDVLFDHARQLGLASLSLDSVAASTE